MVYERAAARRGAGGLDTTCRCGNDSTVPGTGPRSRFHTTKTCAEFQSCNSNIAVEVGLSRVIRWMWTISFLGTRSAEGGFNSRNLLLRYSSFTTRKSTHFPVIPHSGVDLWFYLARTIPNIEILSDNSRRQHSEEPRSISQKCRESFTSTPEDAEMSSWKCGLAGRHTNIQSALPAVAVDVDIDTSLCRLSPTQPPCDLSPCRFLVPIVRVVDLIETVNQSQPIPMFISKKEPGIFFLGGGKRKSQDD
ncbi:hypothetical protein J6590_038250 [Homalodisca vitripennis]|nr:hypothetical protein J6590_038250 [Homalodisca vitripennis]